MTEPEIGWEQYFINSWYGQSLGQTVIEIIIDEDLEPAQFDSQWVDYDYSGNLMEFQDELVAEIKANAKKEV